MRVRLLAASVVLLLAGCTASSVSAIPTSTATATSTSTAAAVTALEPLSLPSLDKTSAGKEAKRIADAVQALISPSEIVYVDDHAQYTAASGEQAAYYGVIRLISIQPSDDPTATAASMVSSLEASGWSPTHATDQGDLTSTSLVATVGGQQWLVILGGDATVEGQSVVEFQLASPDLP